jgi:predicted CXXCH cytochrome family protein
VALGAFMNPPTGVANDLQSTFLTGRALLDTDLSDDHPISFVYNTNLAVADGELTDPGFINLPLENGELQCTTCHDPHEADIVPFLRKTTLNGDLCQECHVRQGATWTWPSSSHSLSTATKGSGDPWGERKPAWQGNTVAENSCFNCHTPHNAATPARLIKNQEENTCYLCHDGQVASDIMTEILKAYEHPVDSPLPPNPDHDAALVEDPLTMNFHVECMDCHNPHAVADDFPMIAFNPNSPMAADHFFPPSANGRIRGVSGLTSGGTVIPEIDFQYELCFKCHGLPAKSACDTGRCSTATGFAMARQDGIYNLREKFGPTSP